MNYVFTNKFQDKHLAGGYLGINKNNLETLPIFEVNSKNKKLEDKIINLVDRIIEGKKSGIDMRELEEEVDRLVYKLYGLTEEDINIIENR